jgi:hypothetical protein
MLEKIAFNMVNLKATREFGIIANVQFKARVKDFFNW